MALLCEDSVPEELLLSRVSPARADRGRSVPATCSVPLMLRDRLGSGKYQHAGLQELE